MIEYPEYVLSQEEKVYIIDMGICDKDTLLEYEERYQEEKEEQSPLCFKEITNEETLSAMKILKDGKAIGLDDIAPLFIMNPKGEEEHDEVIENLTFLFNIIFETSYYPLEWKSDRRIIIYKSDGKTKVKNYRLIAIHSIFRKNL